MLKSALVSLFFLFLFPINALAVDFVISSPTVIGDEIEIDVSLSGLGGCSDTGCYLQGRLKSVSGTYYFGFTENGSLEWVDYVSSTSIDFIKTKLFNFQPIDGAWLGKMKIKNNPLNSNYKGPGDYFLDVRRFTGNSDGSAGESNALTIQLTAATPTPSSTATPTPTPSPTLIPTKTPTPTPKPTVKAKPTTKPADQDVDTESSSDILGLREELNTPTPTPEPEENKRKLPLFAGLFIVAGASFLGIASYPLVRERLKRYNKKSDGQIPQRKTF